MSTPALTSACRDRRSPTAARRSGAALIALVLLALAAATVSLLVVRQVTSSAVASGSAAAVESSRETARQVVDQIRADLTADPELAFKQVLDDELPRRCGTNTYGPGDEWPVSCGTAWTYAAGTDSDGNGVRVMLSPAGARLGVTVVVTTGPVDAGVSTTLQRVAAADQTLWSLGDVVLDDLRPVGPGSTVELSGQVYGTRIVLPSSDAVQLGSVQLLSEEGIVGVPTISSDPDVIWRYYKDQPTAAERSAVPPLRDVREVVPQRPSPAAMVTSFERLAADGCPAGALGGANPSAVSSTTASWLCLRPGGRVMTSGGSVVTIPESTAAVAVRAAANPALVEVVVYDRRQVGFDCQVQCDLLELERASGTNLFATDPPPSSVLTLRRPATGLLGARDLEVHLQPCGPAFLDETLAPCAPASTERLPTVVAGTVADPATVYVSGPARGAVATAGQVVVPYWARPLGEDGDNRELTLDLPTFALGIDAPAPIRGLPYRPPPVRGSVMEDTNYGLLLEWAGALITPDGLPDVGGFETVRYLGQPAGTDVILPAPASRWEISAQRDWVPGVDCPQTGTGNTASLPRRCNSLVP